MTLMKPILDRLNWMILRAKKFWQHSKEIRNRETKESKNGGQPKREGTTLDYELTINS